MKKKLLAAILGATVCIPLLMYVLNPFGTASSDPRARILGLQPFHIPSNAMAPTLIAGDIIIVYTHAYMSDAPRINDVIVFKHPKNPARAYVKRVAATGGDTVSIENGVLYVNQKRIEQTFLDEDKRIQPYSLHMEARKVPEDHLFVLGDNRDNSNDGRFWGYLPVDQVVGRVGSIWYSPDKDRIGKSVE